MKTTLERELEAHISVATAAGELLPAVGAVAQLLCDTFAAGRLLFTFGNGGSAADAQHFTGELVGHYRRDRPPVGAVTLSTDPTVLTCIANDFSYDQVFARQVEGVVRAGDVVAAFTTSGRSPNVVSGLHAAKKRGATTVLFAGGDGGAALAHADHCLLSPSTETPRVQELHTFLLHAISEVVDVWAAGEGGAR